MSDFHRRLLTAIEARRFREAVELLCDASLKVESGKSYAPIVERLLQSARTSIEVADPAPVVEELLGRSRALRADPSQFNCLLLAVHGRQQVTTIDASPQRLLPDGAVARLPGTIEESIFRHEPSETAGDLGAAALDFHASADFRRSGLRIGTALVKSGAVEESKLTEFLSRQYGVPAINLEDFDIAPKILRLVPGDVALKHLVVPVNLAGPSLIVAMCDPSNISAVDDLEFLTGYNIEAVVASEPSIRSAIDRYYCGQKDGLSWPDLFAAVHFVVFAEALVGMTQAVTVGKSWSEFAQKPFTFLGQWWVDRGGKGQLLGQWNIRRVG